MTGSAISQWPALSFNQYTINQFTNVICISQTLQAWQTPEAHDGHLSESCMSVGELWDCMENLNVIRITLMQLLWLSFLWRSRHSQVTVKAVIGTHSVTTGADQPNMDVLVFLSQNSKGDYQNF